MGVNVSTISEIKEECQHRMGMNDMCEYYGVSLSTISRWVREKRIPSGRKDRNGRIFWILEDARRYVK